MNHRIIITGPTASGKSSLAISLAELTQGEIVSIDSRQCYKQIDIGTAKPDSQQLQKIPHHNISVLRLSENDSVASFTERVERMAEEIEQRGKMVIFCGGSTLHIQSLIHPLDDIPSADSNNITKLKQESEVHGIDFLYQRLKKHDHEYASSMDGKNPQRIIRALDVWMQTGKPFSSFHTGSEVNLPDHYSLFALHHPRKELHRRIEKRTDQMINRGLVEETKSLLKEGYSKDIQAFNTVGYKQVLQFFDGDISHSQMVKDIKTATRRYAKRQITWLNRWPFVDWIDMSKYSKEKAVGYIQQQVAAKS